MASPLPSVDFRVRIDDAAVADLRDRLRRTRWPEAETVDDWSQGVPLAYVQELCAWWADDYDMGLAERVNAFPQAKATIDGLGIHFLHVRSPEADALPLVLTHGWPGSVTEFLDVIGPLADPVAHGGDAADAFHVVVPSLPGYGWSDAPSRAGWGLDRIGRAWHELMVGLDYDRYVAQGGDWGAALVACMGRQAPDGLVAIHTNMAITPPIEADLADLTDVELALLTDAGERTEGGLGYAQLQSTRPQTLGYGLSDSPAGQLAWIVEKFRAWTDCGGHPEGALTRQQMLDDVSTYWFTGTATSSARLYWESFTEVGDAAPVGVPAGITLFPKELFRPSRRWAERTYTDLRWFEEVDRGGHFAALEQPALFVDQLRGCFRQFR